MPYLIVQPGDTLLELSRKHNVPYHRLIAVNPQIRNPNQIYPGQVVILPTAPKRNPVPDVQRVVRPGDTMFNIAREFGVPLNQLIALNPQVNDPNLIYPGMILTVRRGRPCPSHIVNFVNRFMQGKARGQLANPTEYLDTDAGQRLDPRLITGIQSPSNSEYDFLSCYRRSANEYVALVALYRRRPGVPGIFDIVLEHILVRDDGQRPRIIDINVQVVLQVS